MMSEVGDEFVAAGGADLVWCLAGGEEDEDAGIGHGEGACECEEPTLTVYDGQAVLVVTARQSTTDVNRCRAKHQVRTR